jgi:very-short-patch-repair endonuclease
MISLITERARELRNESTKAEKALWKALKEGHLSVKFRRQYPIGPYFADIVCKEKKLVIEIDGGQHDPASNNEKTRTVYLQKSVYRVLRFWNNEVLGNIEGVMEIIVNMLDTPPLPPRSRGGV